MTILTQIRATTLRQEASKAIRRAILTGVLKPGQKLVESELAQQLGVSRNPIREAIGELELQGLVTTIPNVGAYVVNPTREELCDALILRAHLEHLAIKFILAKSPPIDLEPLVESLEKGRKLVSSGDEPWQDVYGLINLWDAEFHQCLIECSGSASLLRTWATVAPGDLIFLHDSAISPDGPVSRRVLEWVVEGHALIVEALQNGDVRRVQGALAAHFQAPRKKDVNLDDWAMNILGWSV